MEPLLEPIAETEEHSFRNEMMKRLDIQRRDELFCDVILEVGSGDDQARLKAHRNVLCAASPFFFSALNSDMKENKEGVIRLKETTKTVMEEILVYLYTGYIEINKENAYQLFAQADYFLIESLKALSSKVIFQTLDISNCIRAYYFAIKYQWEELQNGARDFILANFVAVAGTEDFLNLSSKELEEWISSDKIIIKEEEEVFQVIVKWLENGNTQDLDFLQLLRHVRCIYLSRGYVFSVILQHPLVHASTACTKFVLDAMKEVANGTEECFISQPPRNCLETHENAIIACGKRGVFCYVPSEMTWYDLPHIPSHRNYYALAITSLHSKVFIIGGCKNLHGTIVERYEPSTDEWVSTEDPKTVQNHAGAVTLQGVLYVVGGRDINNKAISTVQKYSPDKNQWQEVSPLSSPRSKVCAVADGSYLYTVGGCNEKGNFLKIVERFDPRNNTWNELPSTLAERSSASGTAIRQKVFVFGGLSKNDTAGDPCEVYDTNIETWTSILSVVAPRRYASAVSFEGKIYVFGNFQNEHSFSSEGMSLQVYDIDKDEWEPCCRHELFCDQLWRISTLRISKDVLAYSDKYP